MQNWPALYKYSNIVQNVSGGWRQAGQFRIIINLNRLITNINVNIQFYASFECFTVFVTVLRGKKDRPTR